MNNLFQKTKNILIGILIFAGLIIIFPDTFLLTIEDDHDQTEGEYLIELINSPRQKEGNFEFLYEQLQSDVFTRDRVKAISECSDEEVIWYINNFTEKFDAIVPEFQSQDEANQFTEKLVQAKIKKVMKSSTSGCINKVMLDD